MTHHTAGAVMGDEPRATAASSPAAITRVQQMFSTMSGTPMSVDTTTMGVGEHPGDGSVPGPAANVRTGLRLINPDMSP